MRYLPIFLLLCVGNAQAGKALWDLPNIVDACPIEFWDLDLEVDGVPWGGVGTWTSATDLSLFDPNDISKRIWNFPDRADGFHNVRIRGCTTAAACTIKCAQWSDDYRFESVGGVITDPTIPPPPATTQPNKVNVTVTN